MKRQMVCILLVFALLMSLAPAAMAETWNEVSSESIAYPVEGGNIYFDPASGTVTSGDYSITAAVIPASIDGAAVVRIAPSAFEAHGSLTTVTFPESLTEIGLNAFLNCTALHDVYFTGSAPSNPVACFNGTDGFIAHYPCLDDSWTLRVISKFGGSSTWYVNHISSGEPVEIIEPMCTLEGFSVYICDVCGMDYPTDQTEPTGHTYDEADVVYYPTRREFYCSDCGEMIEEWNDERLMGLNLPEADAHVTMTTTPGALGWMFDGTTMRSYNFDDPDSVCESSIIFTLDYCGCLEFDYGVSSVEGQDTLTITLNDMIIADRISGEQTGTFSKKLPAGTYTLTFNYTKEPLNPRGRSMVQQEAAQPRDMAYIDNFVLTAKSSYTLEVENQPADYVGEVDSHAVFHVDAIGEDLTYQWMFSANGGRTWVKTGNAGNKTSTLNIAMLAHRVGYQYKCVITDAYGLSIESDIATMIAAE